LGRPYFAEQYIEGREFNLSLLADAGGPQVLPAAEIDFSRLPAGKPRIVGYKAKWKADSPEYHATPRRFDFASADGPLVERLAELSRSAWQCFGLRGYARVDFRVDRQGRPWILEINVNPCLSPDAGFAAALDRAGIPFPQAIARILHDCP
jgi:D-alanine-D-alanine ligase